MSETCTVTMTAEQWRHVEELVEEEARNAEDFAKASLNNGLTEMARQSILDVEDDKLILDALRGTP